MQTVSECIVVLRGIKEVSWKAAKGMMSEANFLKSLMEMDVDGITAAQVNIIDIVLRYLHLSCKMESIVRRRDLCIYMVTHHFQPPLSHPHPPNYVCYFRVVVLNMLVYDIGILFHKLHQSATLTEVYRHKLKIILGCFKFL